MASPVDHVHEFRFGLPNSAPYPGSDSCKCGVFRDYAPAHHHYRLIEIDGRLEKIDDGMVDLLEELWLAGVETAHCCQGGCPIFPPSGDDLIWGSEEFAAWAKQIDWSKRTAGYVSFATQHYDIAMPILRRALPVILEERKGVTLHSAFDGHATVVNFEALEPCPACQIRLKDWPQAFHDGTWSTVRPDA